MTIRGPFAIILLVVLVLSLAANFVVAGFAAARFAYPRPGGEIERIVAIGIRAFPPEIRGLITSGTNAERNRMRAAFEDVRAARRAMFEAMRAETFDRGALEAAFADVRTKTMALQEIGQQVVARAIEQASPETRAKIRLPRGPLH
jgi:uncharacterized membrane protein